MKRFCYKKVHLFDKTALWRRLNIPLESWGGNPSEAHKAPIKPGSELETRLL